MQKDSDNAHLQLLTRREVMELLNISRATLYRLEVAGDLVPISIGRKSMRYRMSDIEAFLAKKSA